MAIKMKITIQQLIDSIPSINSLLTAKLPVKAKYAVGMLAEEIYAAQRRHDKAYADLFKEAGCTVEGNKYVHADPKVLIDTIKASNEMREVEILINALPLDLEQFVGTDGRMVEIEGPGFFNLGWAMKKETPAE